jgi:hypothetical protein
MILMSHFKLGPNPDFPDSPYNSKRWSTRMILRLIESLAGDRHIPGNNFAHVGASFLRSPFGTDHRVSV